MERVISFQPVAYIAHIIFSISVAKIDLRLIFRFKIFLVDYHFFLKTKKENSLIFFRQNLSVFVFS